jgi:hypothetical protein
LFAIFMASGATYNTLGSVSKAVEILQPRVNQIAEHVAEIRIKIASLDTKKLDTRGFPGRCESVGFPRG